MSAIPKKLLLPFFAYGTYLTLRQIFSITSSLYRNLLRRPYNFPKRYGQNSWALVTGAAAGIGRAFSEQLASLNMNVIMLGRSENVIQAAAEISEKYPNVQIRPIIFDLSLIYQNSEELIQLIGDRDISILINNAGLGNSHSFHFLPYNLIYDMINVNGLSVLYLTNLLLGKMLKRDNRSAIINISSVGGRVPMGYVSTYTGAKHMVGFFTKAIAYEYKDKIDTLVVYPNEVSTQMNRSAKVGGWMISPEDCAKGSLRQLGSVIETNGAWRHNLKQWLAEMYFTEHGYSTWYTGRLAKWILMRENSLRQPE